jgi:hypothetical protein
MTTVKIRGKQYRKYKTLVSGNDLKATKLAILIMHDLADDTYE